MKQCSFKWFEENHMKANPDKFQCNITDLEFCISLVDTVIEPSDTVDLLGIVIDDKLTFHQHVKITNNAARKAKCSSKTVEMARSKC